MTQKFLLIDAYSELQIGYCWHAGGLDGKIYNDGEFLYHKVSLRDFYFCNDFIQYIKKHKESMARLVFICIVDKNNVPILRLPFHIFDEIYYHKIGFPESSINLELKGSLDEIFSQDELELREMWETKFSINKGEWVGLSEEKRRKWLKIVRSERFEREVIVVDRTNETYYLDGTNITDYSSFFCAIGEAINGPGGYFGFDIMSLRDCLCGGFGAKVPFTLVWNNVKISIEKLDKEAWRKEIVACRKDNSFLLEEPVFEEKGDDHLFLVLLKIFMEYRVNVVLNP
ncbi:barstar family protein [Clostridium beijerinckii]|uniref:barstar family protein n=1 Tax=Clostridium beijerinckii TaxID=1520 RepID=UPI00098C1992|nr:barstar family protein [Clostridium beijerinckii]MBA8932910.1 hypothetical protein [Clostridium beijerinckii]NRU37113.1 hypothetical protein [Clostridium beijerinckii]NSA99608.1 hypothetical protein [Clostridium beijerinckii]OOM59492.1 barstar (barnase inhibitor) [Clostridium beijerinckii]OOM72485.1 barstar (barnase inhibitor) [Clostridium beijerinckii]